MFQSERFFRESWPIISQSVGTPEDASRSVRWILGRAAVAAGARVLGALCGFGRHSVEFARSGCQVTGVDFNETELSRARDAARRAGVTLTLLCQDIRAMDFADGMPFSLDAFRLVLVARK